MFRNAKITNPLLLGYVDTLPDELIIAPDPVQDFARDFEQFVLYEDDNLLVINKPAGVISHQAAKNRYGVVEVVRILRDESYQAAHRLDMDTSGVLVLVKNKRTKGTSLLAHMMHQFSEKTTQKTYWALVDGHLTNALEVNLPLVKDGVFCKVAEAGHAQAKSAATHFRPIKWYWGYQKKAYTLVEAQPLTGRMHQIRVHLASQGYPICGDQVYNQDLNGHHRQLLHAMKLAFTHPLSQEALVVEAPLAEDFQQVLSRLTEVIL